MSELPLDAAAEDVVAQRAEAYPDRPARVAVPRADGPLEADEADARDQADEVPLDEDEMR